MVSCWERLRSGRAATCTSRRSITGRDCAPQSLIHNATGITSMNPTAILFMSCPDQRGLVAHIAQFVSQHNGNIVHSDHHKDSESGLFLMRVEWELDGFQIPREEIATAFTSLAEPLRMQWQLHFSDRPQRMAIFVSRLSHCLHDLLWRSS